jgi:hypothetical protein
MSDIKKLIENMASRYGEPLDHEDVTKCGLCWKNKIQSEVANEFLQAGKLSSEHLKEMFAEVEKRWQQTELYLRVQEMRKTGKSIEEIEKELQQEGIDI